MADTHGWLNNTHDTSNQFHQYLASLYWAFGTIITIGYGDIAPTNSDERLFVSLAMIIGGIVYTVFFLYSHAKQILFFFFYYVHE